MKARRPWLTLASSARRIARLHAAVLPAAASLFAAVLVAAPARAESSVEERAVATDLFKQAAAAEERGAWTECETALTEAVELVETPGLRFHLAYCKEQQQRWVEALVDYRRARELMDQGALAEDVAELLPEAIARLEGELPRLTLVLRETPKQTELYVDGKRRSATLFGKAMPLDPGSRRIEVVTPGYQPFRSEVSLVPRERRDLSVVLVAEATEAPPPPIADEPTADEPLLGPRGWVLVSEGVVSAATLGLGIYFSANAAQSEQDRKTLFDAIGDTSACRDARPDPRCGRLDRAIREGDEFSAYATASYVTSGVAAAALVTTWLLWPEAEPVHLQLGVGAGGATMSASARF